MRSSRIGHGVLLLFGVTAWTGLYALAAAPGWGHPGPVGAGGWSDGFAHPFGGIDHIAAMIAVGLWAAQNGRRAVWLLPGFFALLMTLGAALALAGVSLPGSRDGIAISVAVLGVLLAVAARPILPIGVAVVGLFGLVHGYAHGAEMPESATPMPYALGFLCATGVLQLVGVALGTAAESRIGQRLLPIGAAAIAGIGVTLMLAL
ncbi:MAG: HupE/UreJ family protein [Stellaceae bacterium]